MRCKQDFPQTIVMKIFSILITKVVVQDSDPLVYTKP